MITINQGAALASALANSPRREALPVETQLAMLEESTICLSYGERRAGRAAGAVDMPREALIERVYEWQVRELRSRLEWAGRDSSTPPRTHRVGPSSVWCSWSCAMRSVPDSTMPLWRDPQHGRFVERREQRGRLGVTDTGQGCDPRRSAQQRVLALTQQQFADDSFGMTQLGRGAGDAAMAGRNDSDAHTVQIYDLRG